MVLQFQAEISHTLTTGKIECLSGACNNKAVQNQANLYLKGGFSVSVGIGYAFN